MTYMYLIERVKNMHVVINKFYFFSATGDESSAILHGQL